MRHEFNIWRMNRSPDWVSQSAKGNTPIEALESELGNGYLRQFYKPGDVVVVASKTGYKDQCGVFTIGQTPPTNPPLTATPTRF